MISKVDIYMYVSKLKCVLVEYNRYHNKLNINISPCEKNRSLT